MPIPQFILDLRSRVGTDLLWLTGVSAVVLDDAGRVLLGQRADTGEWAIVSGILEPGEQPAAAITREIKEETGVDAVVDALVAVDVTDPITYGNGDRTQYLDLLFVAHATGGEPHAADDESLAAGFFPLDDLPLPLAASTVDRLAAADAFRGDPSGTTRFVRP